MLLVIRTNRRVATIRRFEILHYIRNDAMEYAIISFSKRKSLPRLIRFENDTVICLRQSCEIVSEILARTGRSLVNKVDGYNPLFQKKQWTFNVSTVVDFRKKFVIVTGFDSLS